MKKYFYICICVLLALLLAACRNINNPDNPDNPDNPEEPVDPVNDVSLVDDSGNFLYTVVRAEECTATVTKAATTLRRAAQDATG